MNTQANEVKRGRGRPVGSTNKASTILVNLSDLVANLSPDAKVPVKVEFAVAILQGLSGEAIEATTATKTVTPKAKEEDPLPLKKWTPGQDNEGEED